MSTVVGRTIGGCQILKELGRGGMGVVYKALETSLNRVVALKILPEDLVSNEESLKRFQREARAVAALNHPNIVTIYSVGNEGGAPYIAMEYVKGRILEEIIREKKRLEPAEALEIARQAAGALAAAHEVNIVHRDIKPHNIMVDGAGRVKILDFGIAKIRGDVTVELTKMSDLIGTPSYMSPEQCRGEPIDGRSDVYALGVVLYRMLAGNLPFAAETPAAILHKVLFAPLPSLRAECPDVPEAAARIVEKAIARERDARYATATQMEGDIVRALRAAPAEGAPTERHPAALFSRPTARRPAWATPRGKALIGGAAAGALALVAVVLTSGGDRGEKPQPPNPNPQTNPVAAAADPKPPTAEEPPQGRPSSGVGRPAEAASEKYEIRNPQSEIPANPQSAIRNPPSPNRPPALAAALERNAIAEGDEASLTPTAADPDGDAVTVEVRVEGGPWKKAAPGTHAISGLAPGVHRIEVRATDGRGLSSPAAVLTLKVLPGSAALREALGLFAGTGGRVDEARARETIRREAEKPSATARMWAAWFYHGGRCGFAREPDHAAALAREAWGVVERLAAEGHADALFLSGTAYDQGMGVAPDPKKAGERVRKAADDGHTIAMNYLGWMILEGRGFTKEPSKAADWFERAAGKGDVGAMHNIGWACANGLGRPRDDRKAAGWFEKGAALGSARNMNNLATMIEHGRGVQKDLNIAIAWYRKAARLGDPDARKNLERLGKKW